MPSFPSLRPDQCPPRTKDLKPGPPTHASGRPSPPGLRPPTDLKTYEPEPTARPPGPVRSLSSPPHGPVLFMPMAFIGVHPRPSVVRPSRPPHSSAPSASSADQSRPSVSIRVHLWFVPPVPPHSSRSGGTGPASSAPSVDRSRPSVSIRVHLWFVPPVPAFYSAICAICVICGPIPSICVHPRPSVVRPSRPSRSSAPSASSVDHSRPSVVRPAWRQAVRALLCAPAAHPPAFIPLWRDRSCAICAICGPFPSLCGPPRK